MLAMSCWRCCRPVCRFQSANACLWAPLTALRVFVASLRALYLHFCPIGFRPGIAISINCQCILFWGASLRHCVCRFTDLFAAGCLRDEIKLNFRTCCSYLLTLPPPPSSSSAAPLLSSSPICDTLAKHACKRWPWHSCVN